MTEEGPTLVKHTPAPGGVFSEALLRQPKHFSTFSAGQRAAIGTVSNPTHNSSGSNRE